MYTRDIAADFGDELDAASVTVNAPLNIEARISTVTDSE